MIRLVIFAALAYRPASISDVAVYGGSSARGTEYTLAAEVGGPSCAIAVTARRRASAIPAVSPEHRPAAHLLSGELGVRDRPGLPGGLAAPGVGRRGERVALIPGDQRPGQRRPAEQLRIGGVPPAPFGIGTPADRGRAVAEVGRRDRQQAGQPAGRDRQVRPLAGADWPSSAPANDRALSSSP